MVSYCSWVRAPFVDWPTWCCVFQMQSGWMSPQIWWCRRGPWMQTANASAQVSSPSSLLCLPEPTLCSFPTSYQPLAFLFFFFLDRCKCKKVKPTLATYLSKNYSYGESLHPAVHSGDLTHGLLDAINTADDFLTNYAAFGWNNNNYKRACFSELSWVGNQSKWPEWQLLLGSDLKFNILL